MHTLYIPEGPEFWIQYYESTLNNGQYQIGGDLPGFRAFYPNHRGAGIGSFFKSLFRYAVPILKTVGKEALKTGSKIASDVASGQNFKDSALLHGKHAVGSILETEGKKLTNQSGKGVGKRPRSKGRQVNKRRKVQKSSLLKELSRGSVGSDIFSS